MAKNTAASATISSRRCSIPNVTVRGRGVMEKCTYCVQRISGARRIAEKEHRRIADGEVVTACEAACPTRAITFGDLSDPKARVNTLRAEPQGYALLGDLGTRPRTTYLARLQNPNPGFREGTVVTVAVIRSEPTPPEPVRWTLPDARNLERVNELVAAPLLEPDQWTWRAWWIGVAVSFAFTCAFLLAVFLILTRGIGIWGLNTTVVWGVAIADYVWWIGIGNAGTLISSMLLLMRQKWRASTNRFAEAMTLFAATIAGIFPIIHLGRPMYFYWLTPYPNTMHVWPQWRSALIWDFWAILSYILFSILFWYVGLIPDLATLRDRATTKWPRLMYGVFALGWRGSARHWHAYERLHLALAGLGVPLVVSLHSVVGMDFAASLMPGWQETIFPPYFVVGAMYSGFAMVVCLAALVRWGFSMQGVITIAHFDVIAKVMLAAAVIMGLSYANEWFNAWYGSDRADRSLLVFEFAGAYAPMYWALLLCNVVIPQLFWFSAVRTNVVAVFIIAVFINIGMWLERILIIWNTLSHDYTLSMWRLFLPTIWDWITTIGSLGLFALMFLVFVRLIPVVSMHEVRKLVDQEGAS